MLHCNTRKSSYPYERVSGMRLVNAFRKISLTSFGIIIHNPRNSTIHPHLRSLSLQLRTSVTGAASIHGALKRITFPTEHIVAVLRISFPAGGVSVWVPSYTLPDIEESYLSPVLQKNGCEPSVGHKLLSLKGRVWCKDLVSTITQKKNQEKGSQKINTYVPHDFIHNLRYNHRMGGWTSTSRSYIIGR